MTDKQIIIDVSDCSELCGTKCHILMSCTNTSKSDSCSEMPNCYYKQLKRTEQECEELKEQRQADNGLITSTGKINHQLLQEYDELKTENDEYIKDNEYLKTIIKDFTQEVVKLKQTLTEIKEIAEEFYLDGEHVKDKYLAQEILQKISECEE